MALRAGEEARSGREDVVCQSMGGGEQGDSKLHWKITPLVPDWNLQNA